ncbi:hypothetical protein H4R33_007075, partial [Dimargaris cristalligena]
MSADNVKLCGQHEYLGFRLARLGLVLAAFKYKEPSDLKVEGHVIPNDDPAN